MKQVIIRQGQGAVEEVPAPLVEAGGVLVRVDHSCISVGTEMSGVRSSALPIWKRALEQPENVKKVVDMARTQGLSHTRSVVQGKLVAGTASGYSLAGTVLEVGEGVHDLKPGDQVACAGAGYAVHAEVVSVPRNLVVLVPAGLDLPSASTVTLGAIALQGVRRAAPTLGETFVVIGLGILGQLTAQLLRANGCRVIGVDLDHARISLARNLGMDLGVHPAEGGDVEQVARLTDGLGADGVIITAATPSDEVVSTAFQMCRKKGRVVVVGDVGLNLNRADFYIKELDFFISSSYGPGRYDNRYEEQGLDYPVGYVRWTENRNMAEYLRLLAAGSVKVPPLISAVYPVGRAGEAYEALKGNGGSRPLMVLLAYPEESSRSALTRTVPNPRARAAGAGRVRMALIGAGGFAKSMHLPNLQKQPDRYHLQAVMSRNGHNAASTAKQFLANYATTEYAQILRDPEIDAVLICTRHNLHAAMTLQALQAGKHVLVEKPLALTRAELAEIAEFFASVPSGAQAPVLLTGFNRRFSPYARHLHNLVTARSNPMILNYRMNAGHIPLHHWVHGDEGGGRNRGEACHIYDLFTYLTGSTVVSVNAQAITPATGQYSPADNFVATMSFEDGSVATLTYTALGSRDYPKEQLQVFADGRVFLLDDYRNLVVTGVKSGKENDGGVDKGHADELDAFARSIRQGGDWPIPFWQQLQAMEIAFQVEEQIRPDGLCSPAGLNPDPEVARRRGQAYAGAGE